MTDIKNPAKKTSQFPKTQMEKIISATEIAVMRSDNFLLVMFESETTTFNLSRNGLNQWQIIIAKRALEKILSDDLPAEKLDKKITKEVGAVVRSMELPYFYLDFATFKGRYFDHSTNLRNHPAEVDAIQHMFDSILFIEGTQWYAHAQGGAPQPPGPSGYKQ